MALGQPHHASRLVPQRGRFEEVVSEPCVTLRLQSHRRGSSATGDTRRRRPAALAARMPTASRSTLTAGGARGVCCVYCTAPRSASTTSADGAEEVATAVSRTPS